MLDISQFPSPQIQPPSFLAPSCAWEAGLPRAASSGYFALRLLGGCGQQRSWLGVQELGARETGGVAPWLPLALSPHSWQGLQLLFQRGSLPPRHGCHWAHDTGPSPCPLRSGEASCSLLSLRAILWSCPCADGPCMAISLLEPS